ncbi:MAG: fumarylacetoacetate hydrolase family protein [Acidimicrobiales bacterium]|jgi:2-keto-4-pentenoate hydratase/2-oxohepta-3-ene-1,7-dioic acid hydratase in catechol pathway
MRLLRVGDFGSERPAVLLEDNRLLDCSKIVGEYDSSFFTNGGLDELASSAASGGLPELDISALRIGAPVAKPEKIVCVGLNYTDHAAETGADIPKEPILFLKVPGTLIGPNDNVNIPRTSTKTDWEIELAVVMGRRAHYLAAADDALGYVAGYSISNDVSERSFQLERGGTWDKGKGCATFNPCGPWLLTADEVPDPQNIGLRLSVNGVERQNGSTANMVFSVEFLVWYISQFMVLEAGDIINTGTPAGVSLGNDHIDFLSPGDVMELEADRLGSQRQVLKSA